ncbi:24359_t:CDS:2, partial [Gigaspora margarita]
GTAQTIEEIAGIQPQNLVNTCQRTAPKQIRQRTPLKSTKEQYQNVREKHIRKQLQTLNELTKEQPQSLKKSAREQHKTSKRNTLENSTKNYRNLLEGRPKH